MEKISSFTVNHLTLLPGVYVSRKDKVGGDTITTFDLRMTRPNFEPVMNTAEVHTLEHLGATFLRNHAVYKDKTSKEILPLVTEMFAFMKDFEGEVPGAAARDCGNYLDMNLPMAKFVAKKYYDEVLSHITEERLVYPE